MTTDQDFSRRTKQSDVQEIEAVAKLRSLLQKLDSESILGNYHATSRKQRLLNMRKEIARIARKQAHSVCNCKLITAVASWELEKFEAELNERCAIHGPCRLGVIVSVGGYLSNGNPRDRRLQELLRTYQRRCAAYRNSGVECR